jgi:molecular chaperone GrpE
MTGTEKNADCNEVGNEPVEQAGVECEAATATAAAGDAAAPVEAAAMAERLLAAEAEAARLKDEYLRALAETENVRRRAARDRQEAAQYAITAFARDLLSVADNLQRALASVDAEACASDPALAALTEGVAMTEKELLTVMERHGVKPIPAEGQPFDPHVHEALYEIPNPDVPHGTVVQVAQTGYLLHDRTLRPARVGIARGGPKPGGPQPTQSDGGDEGILQFRTQDAEPTVGERYRKAGGSTGSRIDESH